MDPFKDAVNRPRTGAVNRPPTVNLKFLPLAPSSENPQIWVGLPNKVFRPIEMVITGFDDETMIEAVEIIDRRTKDVAEQVFVGSGAGIPAKLLSKVQTPWATMMVGQALEIKVQGNVKSITIAGHAS